MRAAKTTTQKTKRVRRRMGELRIQCTCEALKAASVETFLDTIVSRMAHLTFHRAALSVFQTCVQDFVRKGGIDSMSSVAKVSPIVEALQKITALATHNSWPSELVASQTELAMKTLLGFTPAYASKSISVVLVKRRLIEKRSPLRFQKVCSSLEEEVAFRLWPSGSNNKTGYSIADSLDKDDIKGIIRSLGYEPHDDKDFQQRYQSARRQLQDFVQSKLLAVTANIEEMWASASNESDLQSIQRETQRMTTLQQYNEQTIDHMLSNPGDRASLQSQLLQVLDDADKATVTRFIEEINKNTKSEHEKY